MGYLNRKPNVRNGSQAVILPQIIRAAAMRGEAMGWTPPHLTASQCARLDLVIRRYERSQSQEEKESTNEDYSRWC
jgi:hypothetical protein